MLTAAGRLVCAMVVLTLLVACGVRQKVVVYCTVPAATARPVLQRLAEQQGLALEVHYSEDEPVLARLLQKQPAPVCDVVWTEQPLRMMLLAQQGRLAVWRPPAGEDIPAAYRSQTDHWTGVASDAIVLVYKQDAIADPLQRPISVFDLALPRWRGRAALAAPQSLALTSWAATWLTWHEADTLARYLREARDNDIVLTASPDAACDAVQRGECAWAVTTYAAASRALAAGAQLQVVMPDTATLGTVVLPRAVGVWATAPHPAAARQLANSLVHRRTEARQCTATTGRFSVRADRQPPLPLPPFKRDYRPAYYDQQRMLRAIPTARKIQHEVFAGLTGAGS